MFKKGDRVLFDNEGTKLEGVVVGNPYRFVTENERYVEVLFNDLKEEFPVNIKCLERVE